METNERMTFFMELINCNYDLHYWVYDTQFHLLETNWSNELFSTEFFDFIRLKSLILQHIEQGELHSLIFEAEANLIWIVGFRLEDGVPDGIYLVGPLFCGRDTHLILQKKLESYDLSVRLHHSMHKLFESIPAIPSNIVTQYAVMLHYCLNLERISITDVVWLNSNLNPKTDTISLHSHSHPGIWVNEQMFCKLLADGDPRYKEAIQKSHLLSYGMKTEIGDSLRSYKNNLFVLLTLCSRSCIMGGLSPDISYDLNDYYAQKIELCKSITDTEKVAFEMLDDYVSRVQEVKRNTQVSNLIRHSCEYIKSHLTETISIDELAAQSGYTKYYFSHKFKKEMGCSVSDYILKEKIEQAKLLLSGTSQGIQSISDELAFSNRSYFYTCFQKITGMSPTEYRNTYKK